MPLSAFGLVEDSLSRTIEVQPGNEYPIKIHFNNTQNHPVAINLKQSDYSYLASGENFYLAPGTLPRSNASWIELSSIRVVVPPNSSTELFYTIRVPSHVPQHGSYWSVIFLEPENSHVIQSEGNTINVKVRYAHQIVTNVGTGAAKLRLQQAYIDRSGEVPRLNIDIENVGNLYLQATLGLKLYNSKGKQVKAETANEQKILPQTSVRYSVDISELPSESYTGLIVLRDGDQYFGERFTLEPFSS